MRASLHPLRSSERRLLWTLSACIVFVAILVVVLTAQALRTARLHRETAKSMQHDWVFYAAATYRKRVEAFLFMGMAGALSAVPKGGAGSRLPLRAVADGIDSAEACHCNPTFPRRYVFALDLRSGRFETSDGALNHAHAREAVRLALLRARGHPVVAMNVEAMIDTVGGQFHALFYRVFRDSNRQARFLAGMEVDSASFVKHALVDAFSAPELLPQELQHRGVPASAIGTTVTTPTGFRLFRLQNHRATDLVASSQVALFMGALNVEVQLDPEFADLMLAGGVPQSAAHLLSVLDALAVVLLFAVAEFAWRTSKLARVRADFVASVSHDIRTPLSQIMITAETMALGRLATVELCRREAEVILQESRRLMRLIENVLGFARGNAGPPLVLTERKRLGQVVQDAAKGFESFAAASGIQLTVTIRDDAQISIDADAIRRAVTNVIDNAIKYGERGRVSVTVSRRISSVEVVVEDEGTGIPERERERVFLPFTRLSRATDAEIAGSGIGLTITRDIVERHGGTVRVETGARGGARVVMAFSVGPAVAAWDAGSKQGTAE
ncbi:MAG: HAMP domain-containing histidine kinase [Gemmatimonadota bacterium]|nr:HAMP domain-containing histidine kinase [Gemmatimonadota bacterium]